jgi:hypothetical protein
MSEGTCDFPRIAGFHRRRHHLFPFGDKKRSLPLDFGGECALLVPPKHGSRMCDNSGNHASKFSTITHV